jgi:hypothetical protein
LRRHEAHEERRAVLAVQVANLAWVVSVIAMAGWVAETLRIAAVAVAYQARLA